jgi:hypothetical protein
LRGAENEHEGGVHDEDVYGLRDAHNAGHMFTAPVFAADGLGVVRTDSCLGTVLWIMVGPAVVRR